MSILLWIIAIAAFLLACAALLAVKGMTVTLEDGLADARRLVRRNEEELATALSNQRQLVARMARGESVDPEMILEGRLWGDLPAPDALRLFQDDEDLVVVDVRTVAEVQSGMIRGARHIPLDELPERYAELPKDRSVLFYCAAGARSADACEFAVREGFEQVNNLSGGFPNWDGPTESPSHR